MKKNNQKTPLIPGFRDNVVVQPLVKIQKEQELLKQQLGQIYQVIMQNNNIIQNELQKLKKSDECIDIALDAIINILNINNDDFSKELKKLTIAREIQKEKELDKRANRQIVNRPSKLGDIVQINFVGYLENEKEPFPKGSANNFHLELGSNSFIPGFEDGLVGVKTGDFKTLNLNFPNNYRDVNLKGKKVKFEVKVLSVKEKISNEEKTK